MVIHILAIMLKNNFLQFLEVCSIYCSSTSVLVIMMRDIPVAFVTQKVALSGGVNNWVQIGGGCELTRVILGQVMHVYLLIA